MPTELSLSGLQVQQFQASVFSDKVANPKLAKVTWSILSTGQARKATGRTKSILFSESSRLCSFSLLTSHQRARNGSSLFHFLYFGDRLGTRLTERIALKLSLNLLVLACLSTGIELICFGDPISLNRASKAILGPNP
jgi:hypothetical protein